VTLTSTAEGPKSVYWTVNTIDDNYGAFVRFSVKFNKPGASVRLIACGRSAH
jgi:hypothetical protein